MSILILAEKHEQGEKIAVGLGLTSRGRNSLYGKWQGQDTSVCWAAGHLLTQETPDKAKPDITWHSTSSLLPVPMPGKLVPTARGKKLLPGIKQKLSSASEVWIATDPDREGEGIGWNILQYANYRKDVRRLWLSESLEPEDIRKATGRFKTKQQSLAIWRAQQARSTADWLWQILVRAYTIEGRAGLMGTHLGQGKGRESVVSVGRVQSPTLKMVVDRDIEIADFKPVDHFTASIEAGGFTWPYVFKGEVTPEKGRYVVLDSGKVLFTSADDAKAFVERLSTRKSLSLTKAETKNEVKRPPLPHSLTSLQRAMSKKFGMSSSTTLKVADKVRLDGYLTYPRTEHGELPVSLYRAEDLKKQLTACSAVDGIKPATRDMYGAHVSSGCQPATMPPCYSKKPMEHHGIIPTGKKPDFAGWSVNEKAVFAECSTAFVRALHESAVYEVLSAEGRVDTDGMAGEHPAVFKQRFRHLKVAGWLAMGGVDHDKKDDDEAGALPELSRGDELPVSKASIKSKQTKPPKPYTESSLLQAMLHAGRQAEGGDAKMLNSVSGIGTPATRAAVLETLLARGYVESKKAKGGAKLLSTPKGKDLILNAPNDLVSVSITAQWEEQLRDIERADSDSKARSMRDSFTQKQVEFITDHVVEADNKMADAPKRQRGKPTEKQLQLVRKIGVQLDKDTQEAEASFESASAFISQWVSQLKGAGSKKAGKNPPTPKMLAFAERLANEKEVKLPKAAKSSFDECRKFLDAHTKRK